MSPRNITPRRRWTRSQAVLNRSLCRRLEYAIAVISRIAPERASEFEGDLAFSQKIMREVDAAIEHHDMDMDRVRRIRVRRECAA